MNSLSKKMGFAMALSLASAVLPATQDYDDPADVLELMRLFMSSAVVAADVLAYAENGCRWNSEVIWSGGGVEEHHGRRTYGGGFTINYVARGGAEVNLPYSYTVEICPEGLRLHSISRSAKSGSEMDCSK